MLVPCSCDFFALRWRDILLFNRVRNKTHDQRWLDQVECDAQYLVIDISFWPHGTWTWMTQSIHNMMTELTIRDIFSKKGCSENQMLNPWYIFSQKQIFANFCQFVTKKDFTPIHANWHYCIKQYCLCYIVDYFAFADESLIEKRLLCALQAIEQFRKAVAFHFANGDGKLNAFWFLNEIHTYISVTFQTIWHICSNKVKFQLRARQRKESVQWGAVDIDFSEKNRKMQTPHSHDSMRK